MIFDTIGLVLRDEENEWKEVGEKEDKCNLPPSISSKHQ